MFWGWEEPSFEQKIDYIYNDLRAKKRWAVLKWVLRFTIFWLIVHFYIVILPTLDKEKILRDFSNEIIDIALPIIEETLKKSGNNLQINK